MSVYQSVSAKEVIGDIIRKTRVKDTSYILDLPDYLAEAIGIMKTKFQLSPRYADVYLDFHKAKLPCDLDHVEAIECNGHRIPRGNSVRNISAPHEEHHTNETIATPSPFQFVPQYYDAPAKDNPQENSIIYTWTQKAEQCNNLPCAEGHWYNIEPGYITCSLKRVKLRIHYRAMPVDEDGLPLIPDNTNYKVALYYYGRAMMIGSGFEDKIFTYDKLMRDPDGYFWVHARRAIGEITYPALDSMEFKVNNQQRLIKNDSWFDQFFSSPHEERKYGFDYGDHNILGGSNGTYPNQPRPKV